MRSSQAERERTVTALHQALLDGRLDLSETEARQSRAYATQYRDDLPPLLADLPSNSGTLGGSERAPSWSELADAFLWRLHALAHGPMTVRPSTRQRRAVVAVLTALVVWTILWIIVGAVAVAG